ncbi:MAG: hypothetical protein HY821_17050 [Acidobacteria bacterium]|nr:hypothetical protein [Acidobacteriota bacterium]
MFFKREKEQAVSFSQRMDQLRSAGYTVDSTGSGLTRAAKGNLAALLKETASGQTAIAEVGLVIQNEVAVLTDIGFQKIFLTPSGKRTAAVADHLKALHAFKEDLAETLGLTSLYNEGLGTTNEKHLYDRVKDRDSGVGRRAWERG